MGVALEQNVNSTLWFDSWGEGPFTSDEVARYVQSNPAAADSFHTTGWRTYRHVMDKDRQARANG